MLESFKKLRIKNQKQENTNFGKTVIIRKILHSAHNYADMDSWLEVIKIF